MTRRNSVRIISVILAVLLLQVQIFASGAGTGTAGYTSKIQLAEGFTYTNSLSYNSDGKMVEGFELENTASSPVYPIVVSCDTIYGGMTVSDVTTYAQSLGYNVVGAINSDFFITSTGVPMGIVIEDSVFKSSGGGRTAIAYGEDGAFVSQNTEVKITLKNQTGQNTGKSFSTTYFNKSRADGGVYLFDENFSTVSTRTTSDGWAVVFKILDGEMTVSGEMQLEVAELKPECTTVTLYDGYMVLTSSQGSGYGEVFNMFAEGDRVTLSTACTDERLAEATWACGGGDVLIENGNITSSSSWDQTIASSNPRTAIGIKADGTLIYYVLDGRTTASAGATLSQLASDLRSRGCVWALNLDGGGSSIMTLRLPSGGSNTVVNTPSDGSMRKCASYILFVTDETGSAARNLFINETGSVVLAGSSLELTGLATNSAMSPTAVPADLTYTASRGTISGTTYTAPNTDGIDIITISSGGGVTGTCSLYVITKASTLRVSNEKADTVYKVGLKNGEGRTFQAHLTYMTKPVIMDKSAVEYICSEELGTITEDGVFLATGSPGYQSTITVSAGGLTYQFDVGISSDFSDIEGHWAESFIQTLYSLGVVNGVTETSFAPESGIKRGDFMLMLHRAVNTPQAEESSTFSDVSSDMYYAGAISWASKNAIATGYDDGSFKPEETLTREQAFTFVYRFLSAMGKELDATDSTILSEFLDFAELSDYALEPTETLISLQLVSGSDGKLTPKQTLTRAQMAKILCGALSLISPGTTEQVS